MSTAGLVDAHLRERLEKDRHQSGYPFLTVSRQAGAGGRTLARAILRLAGQNAAHPDLFRGWQIVDQIGCRSINQI